MRRRGQGEAEGDVAAEGVEGFLRDAAVGLAHLEVNLAGRIHGGYDGIVLRAAHPETRSEVGHHAVHVSGAALRLVRRAVGHPRRAAFEDVVVRRARADDLVDRREVLHGIEVGRDGSRSGIEDGSLYAVGPFCLARGGKEVAERPGVVRYVARLVSYVDVASQSVFRAGRHSVGQKVVAFQLPLRIHGDAQVLLVARIGIEEQGHFEHLAVGDAVQMGEAGAASFGGIELEPACLVGSLGFRQQRFRARHAIEPEQSLEVEDVPTPASEVGIGHRDVVSPQGSLDGSRSVVSVGVGLHGSPEDGLRPQTADDRRAEPSVRLRMVQRVLHALLALLDEFLVVEEVAQPEQSVGVVGGLFVSPPVLPVVAVARYLARPEACVVGVGERVGMSCQPRLLPLEELQQPALRLDVGNKALLKDELGSAAKANGQRCQRKKESLHSIIYFKFREL